MLVSQMTPAQLTAVAQVEAALLSLKKAGLLEAAPGRFAKSFACSVPVGGCLLVLANGAQDDSFVVPTSSARARSKFVKIRSYARAVANRQTPDWQPFEGNAAVLELNFGQILGGCDEAGNLNPGERGRDGVGWEPTFTSPE